MACASLAASDRGRVLRGGSAEEQCQRFARKLVLRRGTLERFVTDRTDCRFDRRRQLPTGRDRELRQGDQRERVATKREVLVG